MRRLHLVGASVALLLVLCGAWFSRGLVAAQEKPAQPLQKWEYKLVKVAPTAVSEMEASLNKLGAEGWELCATVVPFRRADEEYLVSFIFKRPKR
jgi:Domain of unknown function (DUF4177)